jgi:putative glutamine amidotransferase
MVYKKHGLRIIGGNMRHFKSIIGFVLILLVVVIPLNSQPPTANDQPDAIIAMCRPLVSQIKNIEQMFEKDIIPLRKIKLVVFYHEDEVTDYAPSYALVEENKLSWVSFIVIKGKVNTEDLFKKNQWTEQFKAIFDKTDGIIFTGGMDIPPAIYGEKQLLLTEATTPVRNYYELSFLFHLLGGSQDPEFVPFLESRKDYVILGICLGCQTMNVACGGTLYQDIPSQVYGFTTVEQVLNAGQENIHSSRYFKDLYPLEEDLAPVFHRIKLKKNSIFVKEMKMKKKDTPFILTAHHQALNKLGKDLFVTATSMDEKIIEAVDHKKYKNVLGIQFHPEPYSLYQKGRYFNRAPGEPLEFNLRYFLEDNPPSMTFHKKIWLWFSQALKE